jgi:hypothetical protein
MVPRQRKCREIRQRLFSVLGANGDKQDRRSIAAVHWRARSGVLSVWKVGRIGCIKHMQFLLRRFDFSRPKL